MATTCRRAFDRNRTCVNVRGRAGGDLENLVLKTNNNLYWVHNLVLTLFCIYSNMQVVTKVSGGCMMLKASQRLAHPFSVLSLWSSHWALIPTPVLNRRQRLETVESTLDWARRTCLHLWRPWKWLRQRSQVHLLCQPTLHLVSYCLPLCFLRCHMACNACDNNNWH